MTRIAEPTGQELGPVDRAQPRAAHPRDRHGRRDRPADRDVHRRPGHRDRRPHPLDGGIRQGPSRRPLRILLLRDGHAAPPGPHRGHGLSPRHLARLPAQCRGEGLRRPAREGRMGRGRGPRARRQAPGRGRGGRGDGPGARHRRRQVLSAHLSSAPRHRARWPVLVLAAGRPLPHRRAAQTGLRRGDRRTVGRVARHGHRALGPRRGDAPRRRQAPAPRDRHRFRQRRARRPSGARRPLREPRQTDANGRFVIERVTPGDVRVSWQLHWTVGARSTGIAFTSPRSSMSDPVRRPAWTWSRRAVVRWWAAW